MQAQQFEPMSIGQILDRTFRIYRMNFIRFITIIAVIQVPIALISLVGNALLRPAVDTQNSQQGYTIATDYGYQLHAGPRYQTEPGDESYFDEEPYPAFETDTSSFAAWIAVAIFTFFLMLVGQSLCSGALIKSVSETYLGREVNVGEAYRFVLPKLLTIIGASIIVNIVVGFGFLLLVVPGVIFMLWFALTNQAIVIEDLKAFKGMGRSKELASGNLGKIFSVSFIVGLISIIIVYLLGFGGTMLVALLDNPFSLTAQIIDQFFTLIGQVLAMPISAGALILLYYDLRIRKEGFDLEMLAQTLGSAQPAAIEGQADSYDEQAPQ
ncbi:MAG: hypothetical protein AMJ79_08485 [Phycisphaerae bacterium SM23_30]|nr:MAG: hypothetical protein AMJ79_08485 [Phycisphaerae bacterium SM23_30]